MRTAVPSRRRLGGCCRRPPTHTAMGPSTGIPLVSDDICNVAAEHGHLHVLQWAHENGLPWSVRTFASRCRWRHRHPAVPTRQWLPLECDTCASAASMAASKRCSTCAPTTAPATSTCYFAATRGHMEVLRWAHENGCPWDGDGVRSAGGRGDLETLQWAVARGCPLQDRVCSAAASGGHLAVLQWARSEGCPWDRAHLPVWRGTKGHAERWRGSSRRPSSRAFVAYVLTYAANKLKMCQKSQRLSAAQYRSVVSDQKRHGCLARWLVCGTIGAKPCFPITAHGPKCVQEYEQP